MPTRCGDDGALSASHITIRSALESTDGFRPSDGMRACRLEHLRGITLIGTVQLRHIECKEPEVVVMHAVTWRGLRTITMWVAEIVGRHLNGRAVRWTPHLRSSAARPLECHRLPNAAICMRLHLTW
jgi:hypothetical protein